MRFIACEVSNGRQSDIFMVLAFFCTVSLAEHPEEGASYATVVNVTCWWRRAVSCALPGSPRTVEEMCGDVMTLAHVGYITLAVWGQRRSLGEF